MRVDDFTFELRPLNELPYDNDGDLIEWLADFGGQDQWVTDGDDGHITQAAVIVGCDIIIWQDEPLTDQDMRNAVAEYQETETRLLAEEVFGEFLEDYGWHFESMAVPLLSFIFDKGQAEEFQEYLMTTSTDGEDGAEQTDATRPVSERRILEKGDWRTEGF